MPFSEPVVLCVDDEPAVLSALRRCFRNEPYLLLTASGSREAIAWLEKHPVDLVLTDERMPETTGTELLRLIRDRYPLTTRVLLTGYPGDTVREGSREAGVSALLFKPWDDQALRGTVRRELQRRTRDGESPEFPAPLA